MLLSAMKSVPQMASRISSRVTTRPPRLARRYRRLCSMPERCTTDWPARSLAEADAILAEWRPDMTVIDMDHDDSTALLGRLGASNSLTRSVTPVLGLTRRGDLKTKLRAFDLGVDDILTMPFSPEELLARSIVITRRATGTDRPIIPTIRIGEIETVSYTHLRAHE